MKTNKKVIFGFATAMVFSLALMQGMSTKEVKQDMRLQQLSVGASYMAGETEGGASNAWSQTSDLLELYAVGGAGASATAWLATGTNPVGWGLWVSFGAAAL